jgi:hypothetical protein
MGNFEKIILYFIIACSIGVMGLFYLNSRGELNFKKIELEIEEGEQIVLEKPKPNLKEIEILI